MAFPTEFEDPACRTVSSGYDAPVNSQSRGIVHPPRPANLQNENWQASNILGIFFTKKTFGSMDMV